MPATTSSAFDRVTSKRMTSWDAPPLTDAERRQVLVDWNDTRTDYPRDACIHELFAAQAARTPDAVAIVYENERLTYRELDERANRLAHYLQRLGVGPDVLVGICVERSVEMVVGLLGILKAGGAYVPLDPAYPRDRLAFMLEDTQASVLLTRQRLRDHLPVHAAQVVLIATDGWSMDVFARELGALYAAFAAGQPSPLPDLPIQYADYACWQRAWLQGDALTSRLAYWRARLADAPTVLELPTDRPRPSVQSFAGAAQTILLPEALTTELKLLSQREDATLFMTLLTAFQILLGRYSGQEDVLVGAPIAGRSLLETDGLIGFFVNTLVLRGDLSGDPSFTELLARTRAVTLDAFAHADAPFEQLVQDLHPQRDPSRQPLVQVLFNMLNVTHAELALPGLTVDNVSPSESQARFDLTLYVEERRECIELRVVYNIDLFARARIVELTRQYQHVLAQAVQRPADPISHISLVTSAMASRLPRPDQALSRAPQDTIQARFVQQARRDPRRPAVVDKHGVWSYGELAACGNRLAHYLQAHGIGPGDIVAIYGHRDASLVWALLGVLTAGAAFLILDPTHPEIRLIDCARAARPRGWLCLDAAGSPPAALQADIAASSVRCRLTLPHGAALANGFLAAYASDDPAVVVGANDSAYVAFTSGSTGKPKGIVGLHGPVSHFLRWHTETFGLTQSDRFCMLAGLSHDPLLRDIFTPLWVGATLYIPALDEDGYDQLAAWMKQQEISVAHLTPPMARLLSALSADAPPQPAGESALASIRWLFLGGDVLTEHDVSQLRALAPQARCVNFYGATETPQAVGYFIVPETAEVGRTEVAEARERRIVPLGQGIDNVQLLVLTVARRLAGVGEVGEIYVRTPYLSRGYLSDDALTAERFIANPYTHTNDDRLYRTGDMARYRPDGAVEFLGRRDHQVKIRGYRINVEDIEAALDAASGVREAIVVAREDTLGERRLIAYIVAVPGADVSTEELRHSLRERFPSYMVPAAFVLLDALPLTANGKLDRQALPAPDQVHRAAEERFVAPRTPTEEALAGIWAEALGIERAGALDNFFDLGGHSLLATRVVARVRAALGVETPLLALFRAATLADFATEIADIVQRQGQPNTDTTISAPTGALTHHAAERLLTGMDTLSNTDVDVLLDDLLRG